MSLGVTNARGYNDDQISDTDTQAVVRFLQTRTQETELICSFKPRAIMFLTKRRVCHLPDNVEGEISSFLRGQGARYAVLLLKIPAYRIIDARMRSDVNLVELFRNGDYVVYGLRHGSE
jgi:cytochrome c oxidase subunit 4